MQDFSVEEDTPNVSKAPLFRWSGPNFTINRSREIMENFSKICMKIIKNMKIYGEHFRKLNFFKKIFCIFLRAMWEKYNYNIHTSISKILRTFLANGFKKE